MNFLAHLVLAGDDDGLRLGAMLGDFPSKHVEFLVRVANDDGCRALTVRCRYIGGALEYACRAAQ